MIKLYKRIKRVLHYHEAWTHGAKIIEHWGIVGKRGKTVEHKRNKKLSEEDNLEQILSKPIAEGFAPIDDDAQTTLLIEYPVNGMGTAKDLGKRHKLEERMNETLGWTGLGFCDGGSVGSGTMEVCCIVVDFKIAKRVIKEDLKDTKFGDYSRIYDESSDPTPVLTEPAQGTGMLVPPWLMFQNVDRADARWLRGKPKEYLAKWIAWYRSIPTEAQSVYALPFQEPKGWSGFYKSAVSASKS